MITMTEFAKIKLKEISDSEGIGHYTVRLKVVGGGCAGMSYDMNFEEVISDMDEIVQIDDIKLVVDCMSFQYIKDVDIDFEQSNMGAGFKFINPAAKSSCGCEKSFSI
jgi:iron-sulfur cluster insertion protein